MRDPSIHIKHIHVERTSFARDDVQALLKRADLPYSIVEDREKPQGFGESYTDELGDGKKHLFLSENRGTFFKPCPGTREYQCCDYQVLGVGMNCPIDCVYCILQAYLNTPWITHYTNIEKMMGEVKTALANEPDKLFRIGTGEFTDSLALDRLTKLSIPLVEIIGKLDNGILELKTKSAVIENLKGVNHNGKTIVAWSLNSEEIMQKEEIRAASLIERLEAARTVSEWGYQLAFHFDPIVFYDDWQDGYRKTIEMIFKYVDPKSISWISLGALRFLPKLKDIGNKRFSHTKIFFQEFIEGLDGKSRYFRPNRVKMYQYIYNLLAEKADSRTCIYFCMESDEIWQDVMGFSPEDKGGLGVMLDKSVGW